MQGRKSTKFSPQILALQHWICWTPAASMHETLTFCNPELNSKHSLGLNGWAKSWTFNQVTHACHAARQEPALNQQPDKSRNKIDSICMHMGTSIFASESHVDEHVPKWWHSGYGSIVESDRLQSVQDLQHIDHSVAHFLKTILHQKKLLYMLINCCKNGLQHWTITSKTSWQPKTGSAI